MMRLIADNHNAYPDRFKRFIELAKENGNEFGLIAANKLYAENAQLSVAQNPKLFFNGYNIIVIVSLRVMNANGSSVNTHSFPTSSQTAHTDEVESPTTARCHPLWASPSIRMVRSVTSLRDSRIIGTDARHPMAL